MTFPAALEAVSARGHEMAHLSIDDAGLMAAVMGPLETVEDVVASIDGNVVIANVNSTTQVGDRGCYRCGAGRRAGVRRPRADDGSSAGEPRVPHDDRGASQRTTAPHPRASRAAVANAADRRQRHRRLLPERTRCRAGDARSARRTGRGAGAVRRRPPPPCRCRRHGCSSRSVRSGHCADSSPTFSATTRAAMRSSISPPTTRRPVTS